MTTIDSRVVRESDADPRTAQKRAVGHWAAGLVEPGMVVGLGTGTTTAYAVRDVAERFARGQLPGILAIPTSRSVAATAHELGLPLTDLQAHPTIDLTIDGADEVDPEFNLIKGGGGALLREKIVAQATRREVIIVDSSKLVPRLGATRPVPVEVAEFGWSAQARYLESIGATAVTLRRTAGGVPFHTDQGNVILDAKIRPAVDPRVTAHLLLWRAGVAEVGLFFGTVHDLAVGTDDGVSHRRCASGHA